MPAISQKPRATRDAETPLVFRITEDHIKLAQCKDPEKCVVAKALNENFVGNIQRVHVGASVVKIFTPHEVVRYATPSRLRDEIKVFDKTAMWTLPAGEYRLGALSPSMRQGGRANRWKKHRNATPSTGRDVFTARAAATRVTTRVERLVTQ